MIVGRAVDSAIAEAFVAACRAELRALKPGNVHDWAAGHRMTVADFERSAEAAAPGIARVGAPVGERVEAAMADTVAAVGTNTNLGILLLCAPLALAWERAGRGVIAAGSLRDSLAAVLAETTVSDAAGVFAAIRLANPGGLGDAPEHDVRTAPEVTLTQAMAAASERDRIARQYVTGFADLFDVGLAARLRATLTQVTGPAATTAVFFAFASAFPDTHIVRKHGAETGESVRKIFAQHVDMAEKFDVSGLLSLDEDLKARGINPGTSADLTVATEFLVRLSENK